MQKLTGRVAGALVVFRSALAHRWSSVAFVIYGAAFGAIIVGQWLSDDARSLVANVWYLPIAGISAVIAWRLAGPDVPHRQRIAWRLISLAAVASFASDAISIYVENYLGHDPSANLVANVGYLLYYPILLASLLLLPEALRSKRDALKFGLDVAIVVVAGGMVVWHFVIVPTFATHQPSAVASFLGVAYLVGDLLILLGLTTVLLRHPRGPRRLPLLLLTTSVGCAMLADLLWAHLSLTGLFKAGNVQDLPYMAKYVLFALSIVEERRRLRTVQEEETDLPAASVTALPYVAVFVGYMLLINVAWIGLDPKFLPVVGGAVLLNVLVVVRQIVALKENARLVHERALAAGETRFKSLIQHASDVVSIIDANWKVRFASPSATQTLGYAASELLGSPALDLIHPDDVADAKRRLKQLFAHPKQVFSARWRLRRSDGRWIQTDTTAVNLMADEHIRGLVLTTRDVSERVSLEAELLHQAHHDPLTGLANRLLFYQRVQEIVERHRREGDTFGVLFIDLDKFKEINDSHGHSLGDSVLRAASARLMGNVRPIDTPARIGGDEFAVLLDDRDGPINAIVLAERIAKAFHEPLCIDGVDLTVTVSVGVAMSTPGISVEELLRNADLAMYLAKSRGRGQAAAFEPSMHAALLSRLELRSELQSAMASGQLALDYQPVHALDTQALVGAEALIRWLHPKHGIITPDIFIPIAEEMGLILPIGQWVLRQACTDASKWGRSRQDGRRLRLSVNLSGRQLAAPGLLVDVEAALRVSGLPPASLVLELTESVLLERTTEAVAVMDQLKRLGVRLAIDDFGTGYSSLSYLQRMPIDILKIDRSFVEKIANDRGADAVTRAIVALASSMSLKTIAEGIETLHQAEHMRLIGCDYGQGYYFARPMSAGAFESYTDLWGFATRHHAEPAVAILSDVA